MIKSLSQHWRTMSPPIQFSIVIVLFVGLFRLSEQWMISRALDVQSTTVIGSNSISGFSSTVDVSENTYYLDANFDKSSDLNDDLDATLFVENEPEIIIEKPKPVEVKKVEKKTPPKPQTPLDYYVNRTLYATGIEDDGAFINGAYYTWKETLDTPVVTSKGTFKPVLIKAQNNKVIVSVNGKWFALKVN
ncbi:MULTISPECIES: hypothetical protein [Pseudoalteromonas]|uniref:hypothetical protein n=1 Tax=Pseudoalteromonas TaxID=53246 RepID=UPI0015839CA8|nr:MULTISPECIES: hypothetical protein [Pseudoalteromonas]MDI4652612.1 hypothetical protein [Pseudoalteromonas shioyasakiensis]NUJ38679.1 hypothetical protein [Pseudoalteromonas sp. 0303]